MGQPLIVELVGLPGAGKSTIAAQALEEFRRQGYSVRGRGELGRKDVSRTMRAAWMALWWARRPALLAGTLALGVADAGLAGPKLRHALSLAAWGPRLAGLVPGERVLLDQGVVQQAWSALVRAPTRGRQVAVLLEAVLRDSRARFAFVYCDLSPEVAVSRIAGRQTARSVFDQMPAEEAQRLLAANSASLRALFERAVEVAGARRLVLDATRSPSENAAVVRALLEVG